MDFHCHVDLYPNARDVYAEVQKRMEFVWLVTTSPRAYDATCKVLPATPQMVISPGLHPEVADKKINELERLLQQLQHVSAVGEVGLDGSARYRPHYETQKRIFSAVVERCQSLGGRILSIHSRAASKDILDILEQFPGFGTAVLHWFTDSAPQLRRADALGCWFSVGPAMFESVNGRKLTTLMPRDRVVAESDGPFARVDGAVVMPWDAAKVDSQLADVWGLPQQSTSDLLSANGRRLISKVRMPANQGGCNPLLGSISSLTRPNEQDG
jgi:TatD DNase family protein